MSFFQNLKILLKKHYIIHFTTIAFHFTKFSLFLSKFYKFLQGFFFFMIPKRQNHTLLNLMAAAPCELMVADFADFQFVTEHAAKCANLHFGCVTIKMGE
jgi:hypothetical protein